MFSERLGELPSSLTLERGSVLCFLPSSVTCFALESRIMSLSTTTTATYNVLKYARAYNHSNTASNRAGPPELEWQHFSNPVIRLTLDTRKAPDGRLESMRVRVLWKLSAGFDCMDVDQREAVFVRHCHNLAKNASHGVFSLCRRISTSSRIASCLLFKLPKTCP